MSRDNYFSQPMPKSLSSQIQHFSVVGISYKKASLDIREKFSLSPEQQQSIFSEAQLNNIEGISIISTCNRTEIFSYAKSQEFIIYLFLKFSKGCMEDFDTCGYVLRGNEAIKHLFRVSAGLDSQILGDSQIISQIRQSFAVSDQLGLSNPFLYRLINNVNQAVKRIKTDTELSSGSASVAFTAVQYILRSCNKPGLNILLFGAGKIGTITCINLLKHVEGLNLTVINRNVDKSQKLAQKLNLHYEEIGNIAQCAAQADVVIVATGAQEPTFRPEHLAMNTTPTLVLDLSVPRNADPEIAHLLGITLVGVDELSVENQEVLEKRRAAIPDAELLIYEQISDFYDWLSIQHLSPTFKNIQDSLLEIRQKELDYHKTRLGDSDRHLVELISKNIVNKVARKCINYLKTNHNKQDSPKDVIEGIFCK